jgi:hypothetical protein
VVLLDAVEVGLFIMAQDLVDREPSPATLGTVVAALVQQVGQQARREGADEELVAALTDTVGNAAEGRANRAAVTPAVTN